MPDLTPTVLATARLTLRWLEERDAAAQFAIFSDPEVTRYWSRAAWTEMTQAHDHIAQALASYADGDALRFTLELEGELIGNVSLFAFSEQSRRCEVGYALNSRHWGQGYTGEALRAVLEYGFRELGLNRVEADIDPRNLASARVAERLGFRKEGVLQERWIVHGEPADSAIYGLLRRYWDHG